MKAAEIRQRFLDYFEERGHSVRPSSSLVPADDPTLLFTNAGMVQFKRVFLGQEDVPFRRAATSQKCVRAGGKHNDLEEVGRTARHHTFFEMLGNFSFGDYFKADAVRYAWELLTREFGLDEGRLYATVHYSDDEAWELWESEVGLPASRIFRLGDKDNFWQMADTGPCGPCSELHYDLRSAVPEAMTTEEFEAAGEAGEIVELWNLVFMQYDRDHDGELHPLPAPSIDTGAGLERIAAVLQGVQSNYHTDVFTPLLDRVGEVVGRAYDPADDRAVSYRVMADHARAVAFLLADGVFPSNEGRGYVLRRILRRAVRHAWLLGRREPTLVEVVDATIDSMGAVYPELVQRRDHVLQATRSEEERFLATIEGGLDRFDSLAPRDREGQGTIPGGEVFKLYDTFGFPLDLTELLAGERGYEVDVAGFEEALEAQRARSRADRAAAGLRVGTDEAGEGWTLLDEGVPTFVGYHSLGGRTHVLAYKLEGDVLGLQLAETPFYVESGGQVSDGGAVRGEGWSVRVTDVRKVQDVPSVYGTLEGAFPHAPGERIEVVTEVPVDVRRDTERNHTATHLLHAALRATLGPHVVQRGSLVEADRLRFDFAHTAPMSQEERDEVEARVNAWIWEDHPVGTSLKSQEEAVQAGAMALFGEKYGDVVRVVHVPGVSMELCGGTHVRHTGEIGLFRLVHESGVAAGVRRVEALTGPGAYRYLRERESRLEDAARVLRSPADNLTQRATQLLAEKSELEDLLDELRRAGGAGETEVSSAALEGPRGEGVAFRAARIRARSADDARAWGDAFVRDVVSGVGVVAAELPGEKHTLFAFVTDDLIRSGVRAADVVNGVAAMVGGKGGGRPHMAQAGVPEPERLGEALEASSGIVAALLAGARG